MIKVGIMRNIRTLSFNTELSYKVSAQQCLFECKGDFELFAKCLV